MFQKKFLHHGEGHSKCGKTPASLPSGSKVAQATKTAKQDNKSLTVNEIQDMLDDEDDDIADGDVVRVVMIPPWQTDSQVTPLYIYIYLPLNFGINYIV